ncbi:hypothetical protein MAR_000986 [Mya arenaria]|uniref:Caspase family p10 domain-containing protein n=1 Tax=Mya arenaria TaxID=6604 RepID=A0ABY7FEJ3_MYAAR|nr:hypothetical protein MAR_000986 [Mya arenaria]
MTNSEDEARGDDEDHDSDGEDWDGTGDENDDDSDTSSESETEDDMVMDDEDMGDENIPLPLNIAIPPNFILIFPTWSGRKAKRSPKKGFWMISALSEVVMEHNFAAGRMDFLQALTKVSEKVARRETKVKKDRTTKKEKKKGEKTSGGRQDDGNNMDGQRKKGRKAKPGQKNTVTVVHRLLKPILI